MIEAPLVATPEAPVPSGGEPAWITAGDGAKLRAALFRPSGAVRGSVVLSGGRTEPIEKYFEVVGELLARGFVVLAHDWRGQGLSHRALPDRLAGHARGYRPFLDDFRLLLSAYQARLPRPWLAIGHSMGGCLTLLALAHGEAQHFAGAILSAPMLGVRTPIAAPLARAVALAACLAGRAGRYTIANPGNPLEHVFEGNLLTHDRARFERHAAQIAACPELALGGPTWGWLDFAFRAMSELSRTEVLRRIDVPVTILSAEADQIVLAPPQQAAAERLPKGRIVVVPDARHEILMETDDRRAVFWREFDGLADQIAPPAQAQPAA